MSLPIFRKARTAPSLSPDALFRQGRAVRAAQAALGTPDAVREFLDGDNPGLGGSPLDLAVASEAGLLRVEAAIRAEAWARGAAT